MGETKWNKKKILQPDIKEETLQEGFAETSSQRQRSWHDSPDKGAAAPVLDEMMQKLTEMRNKKKGFTRLPFLESIYGIQEGLTDPATDSISTSASASAQDIISSMDLTAMAENNTGLANGVDIANTTTEDAIDNATKLTTTKKYQDFIQYMANLSYNMSFDIFAYGVFQIANGKQPEDPGKEPVKPNARAEQPIHDQYDADKKKRDQTILDNSDKKLIANMGNRILTCIISIFITYNLYFSYSTPKEPNTKTAFDSIVEWIKMIPTPLFPLKCAISPVTWFLRGLAFIHWIMQMIPFQPLLFGVSMLIAFTFIYSGLARQFIKMGVSVLDPVGTYGKTKNSFGFAKQNPDDIAIVTIVLLCVIRKIGDISWYFKRPEVITNIFAFFLWLMVFGLSLLFVPIGKFAISVIMFYVCMFSMTSSKENGVNIFQTMMDLDEKLAGKHVAYDCTDDSTFRGMMEKLSKFIGSWILNNVYLFTILPIAFKNITDLQFISAKNENIKNFARFVFTILIFITLSSNHVFSRMSSWFMSKFMKEVNVMDTSASEAAKQL